MTNPLGETPQAFEKVLNDISKRTLERTRFGGRKVVIEGKKYSMAQLYKHILKIQADNAEKARLLHLVEKTDKNIDRWLGKKAVVGVTSRQGLKAKEAVIKALGPIYEHNALLVSKYKSYRTLENTQEDLIKNLLMGPTRANVRILYNASKQNAETASQLCNWLFTHVALAVGYSNAQICKNPKLALQILKFLQEIDKDEYNQTLYQENERLLESLVLSFYTAEELEKESEGGI